MVWRKTIILLLLFSNFLFAQIKKKVAVLDFYGYSLYQDYISLFSKKFFTELYNTNKFELVERENMYAILKEQGFQISGFSDQNTVVQIGKILNVDYIIVGNVDIIPNQIASFTIRLINITTGKIEDVKNETCYNCSLKTILDYSLKNLARKIAGLPIIEEPQRPQSGVSKNINNISKISPTINKYILKKTIGIESDISRLALNGYNLSVWYGLLNWLGGDIKFRFNFENFKFPKFYFENGIIDLGNKNYGIFLDITLPSRSGLLGSIGFYYGKHFLKYDNIITKYESIDVAFGFGIIYYFYSNFYFSASFKARKIAIGNKEISFNNRMFWIDKAHSDLALCIGWHF